MAVDYDTNIGKVRVLIPDVVEDADGYLFSDEQITVLLGLYNDNIKRAAAQAKDILATDTALLLKVLRTDDLSVDGAKTAAELREQAKALRVQADADEASGAAEYFDVVYPEQCGVTHIEGVGVYYHRPFC